MSEKKWIEVEQLIDGLRPWMDKKTGYINIGHKRLKEIIDSLAVEREPVETDAKEKQNG